MTDASYTDTQADSDVDADDRRLAVGVGVVALVAFGAAVGAGYVAGREKLVGVVLFAFAAMVLGVACSGPATSTPPDAGCGRPDCPAERC
jgi:hypothetical protein